MITSWLLLPSLGLAVATAGTYAMRKYALSSGLLDMPNARSSHVVPTPRGGGLAIVLAVFASTISAGVLGLVGNAVVAIVLIGGGAIALAGFLDDQYALPASLRFAVHVAAAVLAVALINGGVLARGQDLNLAWPIIAVIAVLGVVWMLNLYNFMDGIDGIAASQGVFMAGGAAVLNVAGAGPEGMTVLLASIATASFGFLVFNWPPAKIFMGDVGSGFLGFVLGSLALICDAWTPVSIWSWITLGALFIGDATATLFHRIARGEPWYVAHRTHAYQWLARRFRNHAPVTILFVCANLALVFPAALMTVRKPGLAPAIALLSVLAAGGASLLAGAGRPEKHADR